MLRMAAAGTSISTPSAKWKGPVSLGEERTKRRKRRTAVILQLQVPHLVDEESLERGMEEGEGLEPLEEPGELVAVDEEAGEEEAARGSGGSVSRSA